MGIAAYNRGSRAIAEQIRRDYSPRPIEFEIMDRANALPKYPDAGTPFTNIDFAFSHGGCWAVCPKTGFGYWYPTLFDAVRRWNVRLIGYTNGTYHAEVITKYQ